MVRFCHVLDVTGPCRGPGRVGTGPGDVFTRVLTNVHRKRAAGDRVMRLKLFKLTSIKLTSKALGLKSPQVPLFASFTKFCLEPFSH